MQRKSKAILTTAGLFAGLSIFATTAFATVGNISGYDAFKKAAFATVMAKNATISSNIEMYLNGSVEASEDSTTKKDGIYYSTVRNNGSQSYIQENYYVHVSEPGKYVAYPNDSTYHASDDGMTPGQVKFVEVLTDILVGDTKNYVITEGNRVSVHLEEGQIPQLVQLGLAAASESMNQYADRDFATTNPRSVDDLLQNMKELSFKNISFNGTIASDGYIESVDFRATIGGFDAGGNFQEIEFVGRIDVSDVGSTVPDSIDVSADNVEIIHTIDAEQDRDRVIQEEGNEETGLTEEEGNAEPGLTEEEGNAEPGLTEEEGNEEPGLTEEEGNTETDLIDNEETALVSEEGNEVEGETEETME